MATPDSPSQGSLTISGVTFEMTPAWLTPGWVALTVTPGRSYWFASYELDLLAEWIAKAAEAGEQS